MSRQKRYLIIFFTFLTSVSILLILHKQFAYQFELSLLFSSPAEVQTRANQLSEQGLKQFNDGEFKTAIETWQQALKLYRGLPDSRGEGHTLHRLGAAHHSLSNYDQAIAYYQQSLAIAEEIGVLSTVDKTLSNLGFLYVSQGQYDKAIKYSEQGLKIARNNHHSKIEALAIRNLGLAYTAQCRYDEGLEYHKQHLTIARNIQDPIGEANALGNLGSLYAALGDPLKAREYHEQNLEIAKENKDRRSEANALGRIGNTYATLANYNKAKEYYQQQRKIANDIENRSIEGAALGNLGSVYYRRGEYAEAIKYHEQHLNIAKEKEDRQGEVNVFRNLANVYNALGDYERAKKKLEQTLSIARQMKDCRGEGAALNSLGLTTLGLAFQEPDNFESKAGEAIAYLEESLQLARKNRNQRGAAHSLGNLGTVYNALGKYTQDPKHYEKALKYYQQKLAIVKENGDRRSQGAVLNNLGVLRVRLKQYEAALNDFNQAQEILVDIRDYDGQGKALAGMAFLYEQRQNPGDSTKAIRLYKEAIDLKEDIRSKLMVGAWKSLFADQQINTYERFINLLWEKEDFQAAFNYVERARARAFLDKLAGGHVDFRTRGDTELLEKAKTLEEKIVALREQLTELENPLKEKNDIEIDNLKNQLNSREKEYEELLNQIELYSPKAADLVRVKPASLSSIQGLLDSDTTLVEYFVTDKRTLAFIITRDNFEPISLDISREKLTEEVLQRTNSEALQQLHKQLIVPLKPYLKTDKVGIVPHNVLHYLSFAALTDGKRYLMQDYTLFTLPSASTLRFLPQPNKSEFRSILALGAPEDEGNLRLDGAREEVERIAELFNTKAKVRKEATESAVKSGVKNAKILHIAAHGEYKSDNPLFSTLYLTKDDQNDGRLEAHEIYGLDLSSTNLVVLSACQTNIGKLSKGDEVEGLNRAFIHAGTPTVIASLWKVDDKATRLLMEQFYKHLKQRKSAGEALRQAQIDMLGLTEGKYRHPHFWAAFVLTGDPGR